MKRKEETLQKSIEFFQEQYGRLLDIKQQFDLTANDIKAIAGGLSTQFQFSREARDQMREWNNAQVASNQVVNEVKDQQDKLCNDLATTLSNTAQMQAQFEALKMDLEAKLAETRKETQQVLMEFLAKINGMMEEQKQKTSATKNRNFF